MEVVVADGVESVIEGASPFASPEQFREAFESKLAQLLHEYDELGVFILVLANASFDHAVWKRLSAPLMEKFRSLLHSFQERGGQGVVLDDASDDLQVFSQLARIGLGGLKTTEFRFLGPWELQFNLLRSLRPPRMASVVADTLSLPFNPDGFHFNRPYLRKEIFWHGWLAGRDGALFFNKYPFVDLHGLLVPEPNRMHPQFLREEDLEYLWHVTEVLQGSLPGVGFGYNSFGAGASVNHLHFQMFLRPRDLPVTHSQWCHNGGSMDYPAGCHRFDSVRDAWSFINGLHQRETSYNLLALQGSLYCFPRRRQGSYYPEDWSGSLAWYEMAGGFASFDEQEFRGLEAETLTRALQEVALTA
jgi:hypothetical protein